MSKYFRKITYINKHDVYKTLNYPKQIENIYLNVDKLIGILKQILH